MMGNDGEIRIMGTGPWPGVVEQAGRPTALNAGDVLHEPQRPS